jgi:hypothetical protein
MGGSYGDDDCKWKHQAEIISHVGIHRHPEQTPVPWEE